MVSKFAKKAAAEKSVVAAQKIASLALSVAVLDLSNTVGVFIIGDEANQDKGLKPFSRFYRLPKRV